MKGFVVKFRGETCNVGIQEGGGASLAATSYESAGFLCVGGLTPENIRIGWIPDVTTIPDVELEMGEEVEVEIVDLATTPPFKTEMTQEELDYKCKMSEENTQPDWDYRLKRFRQIEKVLRDEGLI